MSDLGFPDDEDDVHPEGKNHVRCYCCCRCHCDLRKLSFTNRVIPIWNSWSNHLVSADTVRSFKKWLDDLWSNQEVLYDFKADLHGIGSCSIVVSYSE